MSSLPQPPPTTHPSIKLPKILGGEIALSQLKELSQEVVREEGQVSMCALVYYAICLVFLGIWQLESIFMLCSKVKVLS